MKQYELYVPMLHNDGSPIDHGKIEAIGERLRERFEGLTFFPQRNHGVWKMGGVTFRDEIVIFRVLSDHTQATRQFFRGLKEELKRDLRQEEILIVEINVEVL